MHWLDHSAENMLVARRKGMLGVFFICKVDRRAGCFRRKKEGQDRLINCRYMTFFFFCISPSLAPPVPQQRTSTNAHTLRANLKPLLASYFHGMDA